MNYGPLEPNASLSVTCPTYFTVKLSKGKKTVTLKCAPPSGPAARPLLSATVLPPSAPTATRTSGPTTVATSTPTSLPILPPTATTTATPFLTTPSTATSSPTLSPTAPAAPSSVVLPSVDPVILGTCLAAVHDQYTVVGPDGKTCRMSPDQTQFKLHTSPCVPGRGSKN